MTDVTDEQKRHAEAEADGRRRHGEEYDRQHPNRPEHERKKHMEEYDRKHRETHGEADERRRHGEDYGEDHDRNGETDERRRHGEDYDRRHPHGTAEQGTELGRKKHMEEYDRRHAHGTTHDAKRTEADAMESRHKGEREVYAATHPETHPTYFVEQRQLSESAAYYVMEENELGERNRVGGEYKTKAEADAAMKDVAGQNTPRADSQSRVNPQPRVDPRGVEDRSYKNK